VQNAAPSTVTRADVPAVGEAGLTVIVAMGRTVRVTGVEVVVAP
jgi:hypothetical protein